MRKVLFPIPILILVCVLLMTGCVEVENVTPEKVEDAGGVPAESQQSDSEEKQGQAQTKTETYKIGDSIKAVDLIFTVNSGRTDEGSDFIKPDEGKIFYLIDVTVENAGDESETVSSLMMFKLFDADGYNYNITIGPDTKGQVDGEVSAGRKLRGELVFEIPTDAEGLELQIDPTVFGSGQIIVELGDLVEN